MSYQYLSEIPLVVPDRGRAITFLDNSLYVGVSESKAYADLSVYEAFWQATYLRFHQRKVFYRFLEEGGRYLGHYISGTTSMQGDMYLPLQTLQANSWLLLDAGNNNEPVRWSIDPNSKYYNRYYIDVRKEGFADWAAQKVGERVLDYSGISMDNVLLGRKRVSHLLGVDYSSGEVAEWEKAMLAYLEKVHTVLADKGKLLYVNITCEFDGEDFDQFSKLAEVVDGVMSECPFNVKDTDPPQIYTGQNLVNAMNTHLYLLHNGVQDWLVWYDKDTVKEAFEHFKVLRSGKYGGLFSGIDRETRHDYEFLWKDDEKEDSEEGRKYLADYDRLIAESKNGLMELLEAKQKYISRIRSTSIMLSDIIDETSATFEECERLVTNIE